MNATKFTTRIALGKLDWKSVWLAKPSWDCVWYWGFGYIQNRNMHTHFDSFDRENNRNMMDSIRSRFTEWKLTEKDTWTFCELMSTFYHLKSMTAVLWRGGSHYTNNPCKDIIMNKYEAKRINEVVLVAIFDALYELLTNWPTRKLAEEKARLEKEKAYAKEKIDKYNKKITTIEKHINKLSI